MRLSDDEIHLTYMRQTACLGVFNGLKIKVPEDLSKLPIAHGEWVLVLGGAGSVGKFALQVCPKSYVHQVR